MLGKTEETSRSENKKTIVISKGDFGIPNPVLMSWLKPLDLKACSASPDPGFKLVKGQAYEYLGDHGLLSKTYPKDHPEAGKPRGLAKMFEVK